MRSLYKFDYVGRYLNFSGQTLTTWKLIKKFISFLLNPEALQIQITKVNNVIISQNQIWKYNNDAEDYILMTDMRGDKKDLYNKDKKI